MSTKQCVAALRIAAECLENDWDPDSHVGQFMWEGGAMNSNVTHDPRPVEITRDLARSAELLMKEAKRIV